MTTHVAEKRRSLRVAAAYPVIIRDRRGHVLAQGRTANISECGVFMIARNQALPPTTEMVLVEMSVPAITTEGARRGASRTIHYTAKIVRRQELGQLLGLGIQLVEKLN